ncbi:MAG: hypothetical protein OXC25_05985 [Thiotrichales bacterium]|nr:hypothetical protein [Thiotrichales bacterium]
MRTTILTVLVAGVVLVAGCGGGGGGNSNVQPDSTTESIAEPTPTPPGPVTTSRTTIQGTPAADLIDYLKYHASDRSREVKHRMPIWTRPPVVSVEASAEPEFHRLIAKAVDLINDWLPLESRMVMGAPSTVSPRAPRPGIDLYEGDTYWVEDVPDGVIYVLSMSYHPRYAGSARYNPHCTFEGPFRCTAGSALESVQVLINADSDSTGQGTFGLIVHEFVHALGMQQHVTTQDCSTTITRVDCGPSPDEASLERLYRLDGEALMALYSLYSNGPLPDDINPASLGPWAATIPTLHSEVTTDGGTARFGVEYRTQWTRAWDEGPVPTTPLARSGLTGTATWDGTMVGYSDAGAAVEGDAGLSVDIASMNGTAAFTDLTASGASWGPDLSTRVRVDGNYIQATQGGAWVGFDAQFRGTGHEAVTGAFRWEDTATGNLTGAFGARREE